jgi:hypothetical protein
VRGFLNGLLGCGGRAMKPTFWDCIKAAFNARPIGMFIPPNWVGLAAFGLLGAVLSPGFWVLGAGLELGYLHMLATHPRFQRLVAAQQSRATQQTWEQRRARLLGELDADAIRRYRALERRCQEVIQPQMKVSGSSPGLLAQMEGLGRLLWIYLRLLYTRQAISRIVEEASTPGSERGKIEARSKKIEEQLKGTDLSEDLRKSLTGQLEILKQRIEKQGEAREKVEFLEAELTRIQEQVELIREQAMLSTDPDTVSHRIDQVTATLDGTSQWIRDQQQIYGQVEDLLTEPPPLAVPPSAKESA